MNYRRKANMVLATVFGIFLIAALLRHLRPESTGIHFFFFVSEAALVGGIADWFAVTAIFRKPLGWPYHTALIPRNREKMISGIIAMVQDELLSESLIRKKLESFKITSKLVHYVDQSGGATFLTESLRKKLSSFLTTETTVELEEKIKEKLVSKGSAKQIVALLLQLLEKEAFHNWLNKRVEEGIELASGSVVREKILEILGTYQEEQVSGAGKIQKGLMSFLQASDTLNLEEAADAIQIELILHIRELTDPNNPLHEQLVEVFKVKLLELQEDPAALNGIEQWKNTLIKEVNISEFILSVISDEGTGSTTETPKADNITISSENANGKEYREGQEKQSNILDKFLENWWSDFKGDTRLQVLIDQTFHDIIISILQSEHIVIGEIVRDTLESLSDEELNAFIEDKAGNDLQWIRINGSLVGGVVGAIMFVILNYGYTPLLDIIR